MHLYLCGSGKTFNQALFASVDHPDILIQCVSWHENLFMKVKKSEDGESMLADLVTFADNKDDEPIIVQSSLSAVNIMDAILKLKVYRIVSGKNEK